MKVCILGNGLISLTLAKALVNQGLNVDIISSRKKYNFNKVQTLGISKSNSDFFNKNILHIKKYLWDIDEIEIYDELLQNEKILNFENNGKRLFSVVKNYQMIKYLLSSLKKNKLLKFKKKVDINNIDKFKYKLIINCEHDNLITKKYFYKKLDKNYLGYAHTTILKHQKVIKNNTAYQIFTKLGPIAFLPISPKETSVVYSIKGKKEVDLKNLIKKYNRRYEILKIERPICFELKSLNLRKYYFKNILAFGDLLHRLHPLAGQGFNMSLRDIKVIINLIKFKIDHGLELDENVCIEFEKKTRHKNFIFSSGIDFIYEYFNFESKVNNNIFGKSVQLLGKNKIVNNFFKKIADSGIII